MMLEILKISIVQRSRLLVTLTAMLLSQPSNMERRIRTCVMPQDQTPDVDLRMSRWQDLFCTQHLEEKNLIQAFAFAGTEVKNANEIVFQRDGAPPLFSKYLTFSKGHVT